MSTAPAPRRAEPATDSGDVLDAMTRAHADMLARHGPLNRELSPRPLSSVEFDGQQARAGLALEQASPSERVAHVMGIEAARYEQTSRLATYLAAYEIAYGDPDDAPPLRELGRDHSTLAKDLRKKVRMEETKEQNAEGLAAFDPTAHDYGAIAEQLGHVGPRSRPEDECFPSGGARVGSALSDYVSPMTEVKVAVRQAGDEITRSNGNEL